MSAAAMRVGGGCQAPARPASRSVSRGGGAAANRPADGFYDARLVMARLDNLGKGASGAAVQAMNVHLGVDEGLGL